MTTQASTDKGAGRKLKNYLKGVRAELKKVSWPNKKELVNYTIVVLTLCAIVSIVVWILDTGFHQLLSLILR